VGTGFIRTGFTPRSKGRGNSKDIERIGVILVIDDNRNRKT